MGTRRSSGKMGRRIRKAPLSNPSPEEMKDALLMLEILAMSERAIEQGKLIPQDRVFAQVRRRIRRAPRFAASPVDAATTVVGRRNRRR
jgi:hypothetical protein